MSGYTRRQRSRPPRPVCAWLNCTKSRPRGHDFCDDHHGQPCAICAKPIVVVRNYVETQQGEPMHLDCYLKFRVRSAGASPSDSRSPRLEGRPVDAL